MEVKMKEVLEGIPNGELTGLLNFEEQPSTSLEIETKANLIKKQFENLYDSLEETLEKSGMEEKKIFSENIKGFHEHLEELKKVKKSEYNLLEYNILDYILSDGAFSREMKRQKVEYYKSIIDKMLIGKKEMSTTEGQKLKLLQSTVKDFEEDVLKEDEIIVFQEPTDEFMDSYDLMLEKFREVYLITRGTQLENNIDILIEELSEDEYMKQNSLIQEIICEDAQMPYKQILPELLKS